MDALKHNLPGIFKKQKKDIIPAGGGRWNYAVQQAVRNFREGVSFLKP